MPSDIAIVGFDDIKDGRYSTPSLTTVAPDKQDIAHLSVDAAILRHRSPAKSPSTTV